MLNRGQNEDEIEGMARHRAFKKGRRRCRRDVVLRYQSSSANLSITLKSYNIR
ncbi:hypothetical protein TWF506_004309 [Arthrobotrys conoides]|uniref:Uncharacterized protein n=1 Tax=Arthrobotrys conoides TaxID=74498 RepID=A0AAN8RPG6_9PEZI